MCRLSVFPGRVRCVAFAPPCILSSPAAGRVRDHITSIVFRDDVVSRLGLGSCLELRDAVMRLHDSRGGGGDGNIPGDTIDASNSECTGADNDSTRADNSDSNIRDGDSTDAVPVPVSAGLDMLEIRARKSFYHKLYPAGNILHVISRADVGKSSIDTCMDDTVTNTQTPVGNPAPCGGLPAAAVVIDHPQYQVYRAHAYTFNEMILSSTMFSDHMPQQCLHMCNELFG